ncbi:MAG TPA: hypothetical protein VME69_00320 [Methylocella sp.]|nr:hypothetical protein [Methylocella sp.]
MLRHFGSKDPSDPLKPRAS